MKDTQPHKTTGPRHTSVIGSTLGGPATGGRPVLPIPALCAALLAVIIYLNALDNPFIYDDFRLIVENPSILNIWDLKSVLTRDITRPLVNLSYAIDTALWGRSLAGYHVTNLLLHLVNIVLVFWVALLAAEDRKRQVQQRLWADSSPTVIATTTATLFAVHPMMTEAVGYISGRSETAYSVFFLLAFLVGRRWMIGGGKKWWLTCVALWIAALITKESAAMLSIVLLAYDWCVLDADWTERRRRFVRLGLPLLGATFLAATARVALFSLVEHPDQPLPDWRFALIAVDAFWRYLAIFFVPRDQAIFHAIPFIDTIFSVRAIGGLLGLAGFVAMAFAVRRVHSLIAIGLLWWLVLFVPSSMLVILGYSEPMAEHRAYLSAAGLFLTWGCVYGILWARTARIRLLVSLTTAVFLASLCFQTFVRNAIWEDPVMVTQEAVRLAPDHWIPRLMLAEALRQKGQCADAVPEYRASIAIRRSEQYAYTRLARCLIQERRIDEAASTMRQLRVVNPASVDASMGLGVFAILYDQPDESRGFFKEVLTRQPAHAQAKLMLAFVEGELPPEEHRRMCQELQTMSSGTLTIDLCQADIQQQQ